MDSTGERNRYLRVVLTGAPCAGKSTMAAALHECDFAILEDAARQVVGSALRREGSTSHDRDTTISRELADLVLDHQISAEATMHPARSFVLDRCLVDCAVFREHHGLGPGRLFDLDLRSRYDLVFLLGALPFIEDDVRDRSDLGARDVLAARLRSRFIALGYDVIDVPAAPVHHRLDLVLAEIEQARYTSTGS